MSSNDFFSLVEEYKKKKKKGITTTTSVRDEEESGEFWDLVDQYRGKDNIAPVSSQSIIKNAVREEIAPVSMAQKILGSGMDDETMLSSFSLAEFRAAKDEVSDRGDQVRLQSLFNQKLISNNAEILSKTKMDGKEHSVLEEMNLLAKMDSGDEKDERKSAVLKKMEELGLSTDDYAMYAGDSNFSWENFGNWAGNAAMSGLASFNKGITSTVDLILGNPLKALGWENNPVSEIADYYSDIYDSYKFKTDLYAQKLGGGKGHDFASSAIEGTMGAVPNAILALMTAGTSVAGTAATTTSSLTTQAAYQSGNILTKAGLTTESMMKNPQYWLSFARTYGTDYEEAKSMGASDTAAVLGATLTSLVNAGIEIGTDGLSGIQGLPQEIAEEGGSKLLKWAISNVEEGGEEGLQKFVNEVVAKTMYNHDLDILNPKEYLEEMAIGTISGAALGGGQIALQGASNAVGSAVQNYQDHQLTENEQKVVDKVVEDRIAEKEKDGTKLTKKEKSEIHEEVFQQMKKGYISIETIEEGLGDRSSYDALEKEAKEFDTLYNTATGQLSKAQQDRLAELEAKNNENPYKDALAKSKEQYSKGVFDMVKGDRLSESYREKDRVYQDFQADFDKYKGTKYEEAARKTLESALKAGANNTNRVHDLVDMAAQISADTGRTFEFKSGEQIKNDFVERQTKVIAEMEKIPEAKRTAEQSKKLADLKDLLAKVQSGETVVNGDITSDGVVLNLDSGKPLNRTVGHEVTHSLENAKSYKELKDSLYAYAKSKGIDIDSELNTRKLMYEGVADADPEAELVADLVGDFLFTDSEYISKLSTENRNVFQKMWDKIKYLCKVATAGSQEARELARVEKAFADAYREGGKAQVGKQYSLSSMANTFFGDENMTAEQFKKADYRQTQGYKDYVDQCLNNYRQTRADFDEATARKSIEDSIEGIVKVAIAAKQAGYDIYDDSAKRSKKDSKKRLLFSSLEPNSDYFTSSDISTICDKRKNFAEIYDDIVRAEEAKGVPKGKRFFDNVDNYFAIHKIMADKGLTTPCRQCYVESMRKNLAPMANAFLRLVQETNPDNTANDQLYHQKGKQKGEEKTSNAATREFVLSELIAHPEYNMSVNDLTVETLTTADGLAQLKLQAPTIYEAFNSFYGQSKPKMPKGATPFRFGELTALLTDEKGKIKKSVLDKINSTGGFRLQSYSDFQIQNYTDVLQVLFEAGTLGLKGHAYTKVPAFLDATEGTNLKRNISIFMYKDGDQWKLDKNDSFPYDLEEIYDLVKADESGNTGIIAVSQNADMSAWVMANDYVGYGIPFHKSGLKMGTVRDTEVKTEDGRVIKGYSGTIDHTKQQTEVWAKAGDGHKAETKVKNGINIYSFWDFDNKSNLSKNELIEKNVKAYIDQCELAGYLPKFRAYVMNNGKVLQDVLKYSKELGFVGEDATIEDISFQYKGYTIPYGYYKFLGDFGMFTPDGKASAQKTLSLEEYDFDKAVKFFSDSETLRRNEILQQFANGEERQRYRDSDLTAGELQDIVKQKRREVAESVVGDIAPSMSLSSGGDQFAPTSSFDVYGKDFRVQNPMQDNVAPAQETVSEMGSVAEESSVTEDAPVDVVEDETTTEDIDPAQEIKTAKERLSAKLSNSQTELANVKQLREESSKSFDDKIAKAQALLDSKKNQDTKVANNIKRRIERLQRLKADVDAEYAKRINDIESKVTKTNTELEKDHTKQDNLERAYARIDAQLEREKAALDEEFNQRRESLKDKNTYISQKASELYNEIRNLKKGVRASDQLGYLLDTGHDWSSIRSALVNIKHTPGERVNLNSAIESIAREMLNEDYENSLYNLDDEYQAQVKQLEEDAEKSRDEARKAQQRVTRKNLHAGIVDKIKARFAENGFDFDSVLKKAKNLSTFATVDNTPQRVMEKSLGYKEGGVLADLTVNKVAQNETEGIKWLNSFTDKKSGLLANISKQYGIKPGSKASAAAQMYAEGFYVNDNNEIIQYGDAELAQDFKDAKVRENIKKLARDPRIRQIYDETLAMINESRVRNGYPEIPRLDNYFLHFRAMDDTFSRLGLPFNPNDIKAKDLPTDLNGVTADLKPGQPYFASAMHRTGKRTSFDLLGGLEKYLTSAKNQIYHIDDIQTLRALRNYIADTYGQANGLEGLDALTEEEAQDRIEKVYNSHLSTFAKFLNEEANILAGKTALIDRGLEGIIGRRGITFLNTVNGQVGSNMVGFNLSSSLTNFLPVAQTFAKTNKADFLKAFGQMVYTKTSGRSDGFTENSPVVIRRKGADRFHRTPYQKVGDLGYVFMSAVDDISTELIARTKYNELTRKGMDSQQAHYETDKWVSRLMGDRSIGQMPQIYNSKMLGLITKFQLEVRNQLDSQFYDTIQEAKVSNEEIQNRLERNAKTAAKVTSTFVQLAVAQHLFGMAFESVAGYNPAFDIIEVMIKALGWDDEEDSEDTALDNIEQGFFALLEDLPYTSTFTGGRIPIESALPIEQFIMAKDQYGNEKSRLETLGEVAPYYLLPGGYGQIKKTAQGLGMFSDEHPIAGSYTDSGALRFPVEDTWQNRLQAGVFGQYASQNARYYFDNDIAPLKDKQIQEFIDVDMPIRDYWDYRKGLSGLDTLSEKADYIDSLDLTDEQKNILINNIADRKEDIDMSDYGNYGSFEEFDFAEKYPEKYEFFTNNGISYEDYASADEEGKRAYTWASENPGKYEMSKAISDDFLTYWQYKTELGDLEGDKDANGKTISGSKKSKVIAYINDMDLDYGQKIILFKSEYNSDDTYNYDIIEYLNGRDDISYRQMETILKVLGFNVDAQGNITWD